MHQQRIINGIEDVFRSYMYDEELRKVLIASGKHLELFGQGRVGYFLTPDREVLKMQGYGLYFSSPRASADAFFMYFCSKSKLPITLTSAKKGLAEDLGVRVEQLKKDYVRKYAN